MARHSSTTSGTPGTDARRQAPPGEDPGTLTDEEYLSVGGPDALDSAAPRGNDAHDERTDDSVGAQREAHPDSPPKTPRAPAGEDPERSGDTDPD
ncbi:MAG TPA: hypothetical protein VID71_06285 [Steroidobacteraceae bacterium]